MAHLLLLNGPNLNLLGTRDPKVYGSTTLAEIDAELVRRGKARGAQVRSAQSNIEGELVDLIQRAKGWADAIVINPGAYTHYSYSLRDAISATRLRVVEVHLSDLTQREPWRRVSLIAEVAAHRIMGKGIAGYLEALEWLATHPR